MEIAGDDAIRLVTSLFPLNKKKTRNTQQKSIVDKKAI